MITKHQKKELYRLLHILIRKRDGERCLRCGKTEALHLSHIYPRGKYRKLQFDERNLILLCAGCHLFWFHKHPLEAGEWIKTILPKERLDKLKLMANSTIKSPMEYKLLKLYFEQKIKKGG